MNSRRQDKKREIRGRLDRPVGEGLLEAANLWETLWLGEGSHGMSGKGHPTQSSKAEESQRLGGPACDQRLKQEDCPEC